MTIREASERTGLSADSLRYYERIGLIPPIPRKESGVRDYTEESLRWIEFAMCFKKAGVSLEAIIEYIALARQGDATKAARREILVQARESIVKRISALHTYLKFADYKLAHYDSKVVLATDALVRESELREESS